jgi:hypothetical protein
MLQRIRENLGCGQNHQQHQWKLEKIKAHATLQKMGWEK